MVVVSFGYLKPCRVTPQVRYFESLFSFFFFQVHLSHSPRRDQVTAVNVSLSSHEGPRWCRKDMGQALV